MGRGYIDRVNCRESGGCDRVTGEGGEVSRTSGRGGGLENDTVAFV